jgi:hypothetical protein
MMEIEHEDRTSHARSGVHRRARGVPPIRRRYAPDSFRSAFNAGTPRTCLQKEVLGEPKSKRPQAKGQAPGLGPRFPRHGLVDRFRFVCLTGEFRVGQPLTDDLADADVESLRVSHLPIVESERLLIDVAEQMERFHADVSSVQLALNETPEVLHAVSVNVAIRVLDGMINDLMFEVILQAIVRPQFVREDRRARFYVFVDVLLKFLLTSVVHNEGTNVTAALQHTHDDGLIFAAGTGYDAGAFALMHITRLAADEGLVDLDTVAASAELTALLTLLRESNPVQHKPSCLLGHVQRPRDLTRADTVLAIQDQPHGRQPLIESKRRVFKNGSDLHGKLPLRVPHTTLPTQLVLEETDALAAAPGANHAFLPLRPSGHEVVKAVVLVREVEYSLLKALRFAYGFHTPSLPRNRVLGKYIITQFATAGLCL